VFAANRAQGNRKFATEVKDVKSTGSDAHTTYPPASPAGGSGKFNGRSVPKSRRRRGLIVAGGALTIGVAAVTISDDAKHAYTATQRSYRVLETLVLNIREYVLSNLSYHAV
jgi:aarF domain-containing kinase